AVIGNDALIGAGALVPPGMKVPRGMLMLGQPAKPVRKIKSEEKHNLIVQLKDLETKAKFYRKQVIER
ncbi:MAG: gamma carbonic anhydrase family protein, partial [Candidatus Heimdallarchaeota archaeon]|nr:gamma carbonic anhydrase family protein [Candidatus Heimdallarchaeota archaeon]